MRTITLFLLISKFVFAGSDGPNPPSGCGNPYTWGCNNGDCSDAYFDDSYYWCINDNASPEQSYDGFSFSQPGPYDSITVDLKGYSTDGEDVTVYLSDDVGQDCGSGQTVSWGTTEAIYHYKFTGDGGCVILSTGYFIGVNIAVDNAVDHAVNPLYLNSVDATLFWTSQSKASHRRHVIFNHSRQ